MDVTFPPTSGGLVLHDVWLYVLRHVFQPAWQSARFWDACCWSGVFMKDPSVLDVPAGSLAVLSKAVQPLLAQVPGGLRATLGSGQAGAGMASAPTTMRREPQASILLGSSPRRGYWLARAGWMGPSSWSRCLNFSTLHTMVTFDETAVGCLLLHSPVAQLSLCVMRTALCF